jgi:ELWxxDGT repeat protein
VGRASTSVPGGIARRAIRDPTRRGLGCGRARVLRVWKARVRPRRRGRRDAERDRRRVEDGGAHDTATPDSGPPDGGPPPEGTYQPIPVAVTPYVVPVARNFAELGGRVFFVGDDGATGNELWVTDGTPAGTRLVRDIHPAGSSSPQVLTALGATLLFFADDGTHGMELWRSDGTTAGTSMVRDVHPTGSGTGYAWSAAAAGFLFFRGDDGSSGSEPWVTDGTELGTRMLVDLSPGPAASNPYEAIALDSSRVLFRALHPTYGVELFVTDGTPSGTRLVADANPSGSSLPDGWYRYFATDGAGTAFYRGTDGVNGLELWRTDGTASGTRMVADLLAPGDGVYYSQMTRVIAGRVLFVARSAHDVEPHATDVGATTAFELGDIEPAGASLVENGDYGFTAAGTSIFFAATDAARGIELWATTGEAASARLVRDIHPAGSSAPWGFFAMGDELFFGASDGTSGVEPWRSDGTEAGTVAVADLSPGPASSYPYPLGRTPAGMVIAADGGAPDRQIWIAR